MIVAAGIEIKLPPGGDYVIGDRLKIIGKLKSRVTENGIEVLGLEDAKISEIKAGSNFQIWMAKLRHQLQQNILGWLPADEGGLAAGILVGGDDLVSNKGIIAYRKAGMSHVMAASGYNVTVVAGWMAGLLGGWVNRWLMLSISIVCIIMYVFVAGANGPVIRAGMMGVLVIGGKFLGRPADGTRLLMLTVIMMVLVSPGWLSDIGWQLSVAATVGMMQMEQTTGKGWKAAILGAAGGTLWAQIYTLPLILHYFGNLSLIAPVANLLLLWPVPTAMPILASASFLGMVWPAGGGYLALLAWPLLKLMNTGTQILIAIPGASMTVAKMGWGWVAGMYVMLLAWNYRRSLKK